MANHYNRRQDHLKSSPLISDSKVMKLTSQPRKTKAQTIRAEKKKMIEKRVVNSLTELIDSKNEEAYKNTLVFRILVKNIMRELVESGKCADDKACLATARKMAAFVTDVMKETYKKQKVSSRVHSRISSTSIDKNKSRSREPLPRIPEERIKKIVKPAEKKKETIAPVTVRNEVKRVVRTPPSPSKVTPKTVGNKGDSVVPKIEKERINNWLDNVGDRTKKWTEWIKDTVDKAEHSKKRVRSGESLRSVSEDWKKFVQDKGKESRNLKESYSSNIWQDENDMYRRRGQESIQQWLLKNKLNTFSGGYYNFNPERSNYSVRSTSSDSLCSAWSSRAPSSLFGGDLELSRLRDMGMFR